MKKTIVLLVLVSLLCGLSAGCHESGTDSADILGIWQGSIDMAGHLYEGLSAYNPEFAALLDLEGFSVPVTWQFEENGTYSMKVDPVAMEAAAWELTDRLRDGLYKHLKGKIETEGLSLTVDELLELADTDLDTLLRESFGDDPAAAIAGAFKLDMSGNYELGSGKLYLSADLGSKVDKKNYYTYELHGDKLLLDIGKFEDSDEEKYASMILPLELKKD